MLSAMGCRGRFLLVAGITAALGLPPTPSAAVEEHPLGEHLSHEYRGGLATVLEKRYLRVLTSRNSFDYYVHKGQSRGYQYEMVKAFVKHLNRKYHRGRTTPPIQFELLPVSSDQLIPLLLRGGGDMIASRMTITPDRAERVLFSIPYKDVDEVVVTNQELGPFRTLDDLSGRSFAVRRSSSYHESLTSLNQRLASKGLPPVRIVAVEEEIETEDIIGLVSLGRYQFTVADSILAKMAVEVFDGVAVIPALKLRTGGKLAWATHPDSADLQREMNEFLPRYREGSLLGNIAVRKYFENFGQIRLRIGDDGSQLSSYDALFRRYAQRYGFDWRLIAAVAYQESRFNQKARNRSGATGLFQIKPATAREPYIGIPRIAGEENAEHNIHAGVRYLAWIKRRYFDSEPGMKEKDRVRMTLAAFNAGPATVRRAIRRAEAMNLDPLRWFRNVEISMLSLKRSEPVKYVSEINKRYLSYILLGVE